MTALLDVQELSVSYGGVRAVHNVDLSVSQGEIVGLIGPNGAGKTSLIDGLTGFTDITGSVVLNGIDITDVPPHRRQRLGLARTWQQAELFDDLTVEENLYLASHRATPRTIIADMFWPSRSRDHSEATAVLDPLGIGDTARLQTTSLSLGQRKLVGVARALAGHPRLVCMDEPAAGLDTTETRELGHRIRSVAAQGTSVFLVDHDMRLMFGICHRIYVLNFGVLIAHGAPTLVRQDPAVVAAYLGNSATQTRAAGGVDAIAELQ